MDREALLGQALNFHRAAIDLTEKAITELKDRQTRAAMRMDSMDVRHEEVSGGLNRTKTALEEKSAIVDQHSLMLDDAQKNLTDLKDRQHRSAAQHLLDIVGQRRRPLLQPDSAREAGRAPRVRRRR